MSTAVPSAVASGPSVVAQGAPAVAPATPAAPPQRHLYVSLSGTERTEWIEQAVICGVVIFAVGFAAGRLTAPKKGFRR